MKREREQASISVFFVRSLCLDDAKSERQRSIYSAVFYSSLTGYKMCLRLFLNGNNEARHSYLSIYSILMRSEYDALLEWPFRFKVTFTLLNQAQSENDQDHFSAFFWPDISSSCFQRPRSNMNDAYGFEKFFSLNELQCHRSSYVRDDTLFIQVAVDFLSVRPGT